MNCAIRWLPVPWVCVVRHWQRQRPWWAVECQTSSSLIRLNDQHIWILRMVVDVMYQYYHYAEPLLDWQLAYCCFLPVNVSLAPVKKSCRYQIPAETERFVTVCVTCWRFSVHWVQKQVEALAKQDCFQCWSASKTMNALSHQKPYMSHARNAPPPPPPPLPIAPPQMDRSQSMSADYN